VSEQKNYQARQYQNRIQTSLKPLKEAIMTRAPVSRNCNNLSLKLADDGLGCQLEMRESVPSCAADSFIRNRTKFVDVANANRHSRRVPQEENNGRLLT